MNFENDRISMKTFGSTGGCLMCFGSLSGSVVRRLGTSSLMWCPRRIGAFRRVGTFGGLIFEGKARSSTGIYDILDSSGITCASYETFVGTFSSSY